MTTEVRVHESETCDYDNGQPCQMCVHADEYERQQLATFSPFAAAWASAPREQRDYVEQDCAAYWFTKGRKAEQVRVLEDLVEMNRLAHERMSQ